MQTMDFSAHHNLVTRKTTEIHVPADAELTLPPVHFPHSAHTRFECTVCHHTGHEDGKSLLCTSSGCHDGIKDQGTEDAPDPRYFRNAFHGPTRSCYYCHSTAKAEGRMAGPVACKDCHTATSSRWTEQETAPDNANTNTAKSEKIGREKTDSVEQEKQDGATGSD